MTNRHFTTLAGFCVLAALATLISSADAMPSGYGAAVLADNPVIYYRLSESDKSDGQTAVNSAATGALYDGTYHGTVGDAASLSAQLGRAAAFDDSPTPSGSTGDHVRVNTSGANPFPGTAITAEFWMNSTQVGQSGILSYNVGASNEFLVFSDSTNLTLWLNNVSMPTGITHAEIFNGQWNHVALSWSDSSDQVDAYLNGELVNSFIFVTGALTTTGSFVLAQEQDSEGGGFAANQNFEGLLDEVAIYASVLPADRIAAHFEAAFVPEPGSGAMLLVGLTGWLGVRRRRLG